MPTIADLGWLPSPPGDFAAKVAAAIELDGEQGAAFQHLAGYRLDARQARRLGKAITASKTAGVDLTPLSPFRLTILSNATFDFIADHLSAAAARHGVALDVVLPPYDQAMQQAMDPGSETARAASDAILVALDHRWYGLAKPALGDPGGALATALGRLTSLLDSLAANAPGAIILSTVPAPPTPLFGSLDVRVEGSPKALIEALNRELARIAGERNCLLLDAAALAARVGTDHWFNPVQYFAYKLPFASDFDPVYADALGRLIGAARGKARKCLVLDLDNTLWGGVVGDDGVESLVLGSNNPRGEAFLSVQKMAVDLSARGIILAVSSKNDDALARNAFDTHPEMALSLADIAVFQANWLDKASNLEAIASTLNIGLDALVLLDDNPAERAQTRAALPMVAIPELPDDPAWFAWTLAAAGYFEAASFTGDDLLRAASYAADAKRADVETQTRDLGDYLASLDMCLSAGPFDTPGRARISQLINKTNQFNLTTHRYTEAEVAAFEADPAVISLQVRLADRFGDLGMIGVIIAIVGEAEDGVREAIVDTWLMSCRVLGRKVEEAMLALLVERAREAGAVRIKAEYRPTAKNGMVRELFDRLGLSLSGETETGARAYSLTVDKAQIAPLPHQIIRSAAWSMSKEPAEATG
jgi:FkbH-like protein